MLQQLKTAAMANDWSTAGNVYIELSLGAPGMADRFRVEVLAPAIRLRDGEAVVALVDQIGAEGKA